MHSIFNAAVLSFFVCFFFNNRQESYAFGLPRRYSAHLLFFLLVKRLKTLTGTEKKRDAPNARQSDHRVYDTAYKSRLPTAQPCDDIKLEKTYASPVQSTDDAHDERDPIHNHLFDPPVTVNTACTYCLTLIPFL